jgi:hypothetical protein
MNRENKKSNIAARKKFSGAGSIFRIETAGKYH